MATDTQPFNPSEHLISLGKRGGKDQLYLECKWRLVWFREARPDWGIVTEPVTIDLERQTAVFRAQVIDAEGRVVATGTAMETAVGFKDFVEKAETSAIGRALAVAGFGTQFAPELEEGGIVDSPVPQRGPAAVSPAVITAVVRETAGNGNGNGHPDAAGGCECGATLTAAAASFSTRTYGRPTCPACQRR